MKYKISVIYPDKFEEKVGFHLLRDKLKALCLSPLGQKRVDLIRFHIRYDIIRKYIDQVAEMKYVLETTDDFPVDYYFDLTAALDKARVEGSFMELEDIYQLYKSLGTIKSIVRFFKDKDQDLYYRMKDLCKKVKTYPYVTEAIEKIISKQGKLKDNASVELKRIKTEISVKHASVNKVLNRVIKSHKESGIVEKEASASVRDGRLVVPVEASKKRSLQGIIHDESATGKTVFIEPTEVVELNNQIKELELAEKREITKILRDFTKAIHPYLDDLELAYEFLGTIDFIRAKARLAIQLDAHKPNLKSTPTISWKSARHPSLFLSFKEQGKNVVPLHIELENENRILIISGPNAGGKSVCLKSVGIIQYMLQCGFLVPVDQDSTFGIFQNLFINIGDEQSIENDLSTYSSHLINMKHFLKHADEQTLLLIDEFGVGTEPMLGGAIAESILVELNRRKCFGVITTHYSNLKHFASSAKGIINGAMLYDSNKMEPLFELEIGKPGSSFAFEIASKIGLPNEVIEKAKDSIGQDHVSFDKHLREIARDKKYWERKRQNIRKSEKRLEEILEKQTKELEELKKERKDILKRAKEEAEDVLRQSNKKIEHTIRIIKESQAEKEKTKEVRKSLEDFKDRVSNLSDKEQEKIEKKYEQVKKKENQLKKKRQSTQEISNPKIKIEEEAIRIGNKVKIIDQDVFGEVIDMGPKSLVVAFGNMVTTIEKEKVRKISGNEYKKQTKIKTSPGLNTWDLAKRKINFSSGLDIRGKRAEEAIQMVTEFIDEAIMVEERELKILHGKGNGVLRQVIRDYLKTVDLIEWYGDAHVDFGGAGITVVKLGF